MSDQPNTPETQEQPDAKLLSQDDVNRIVAERVARERKSTLEKLGVSSLDDALSVLKAQKEREEAEAIKRGEYEKLLNDLKPQAERAAALEATLKTYLEAEIADIPEEKRTLIPQGDVTAQLAWVKQAKALGVFGTPKPTPPPTDAGVRGDSTKAAPKLTDTELQLAKLAGMTPEQYAEYRAKRQGGQ